MLKKASRKLIVELFIPRSHNNYALLSVDFLADISGKTVVNLGIDNLNNERFNDSIALTLDTVIWGIMDEYEKGILPSVEKHLNAHSLPSGIIFFNIFAHGEIGSGTDMFRRVSDVLLSLLICENMDEVAAKVKEIMLQWDHSIREEYGQKIPEDIYDVYGKKKTLLSNIEEYYGIELKLDHFTV